MISQEKIQSVLSLSAYEVHKLVESGEVSPLTIAQESIRRCKKSTTNAIIETLDDLAIHTAQNFKGPLSGVTISIKDIFACNGYKTTAGSKILTNYEAVFDSTVVARLKKAGAIITSRTNMDEFAMGSSGEHSVYGATSNPWCHECVPGGSSSGSAASVSEYLVHASIGSDTGGSSRQPAAFCGIVGLKLSYGYISRFGVIPYASSFDCPAVFARSVLDACMVVDAISGKCPNDMTSKEAPKLSLVEPSLHMRVGFAKEHMQFVCPDMKKSFESILEYIDPDFLSPVKLCDFKHWLSVYYCLTTVEAFSNLNKFDGIRYGLVGEGDSLEDYYANTRSNFGNEVKKRITLGASLIYEKPYLLEKAQRYRVFLIKEFDKIFDKVDVFLLPTSPGTAFKKNSQRSSTEEYAEDMFTLIANIIEAPCISIPCGISKNGLPMGISIMSKRGNDEKIVSMAKALEKLIDFQLLQYKE